MAEIRVTTEDLPRYKFPLSQSGGGRAMNHSLVQARADGHWLPRWVLVDDEGTALAVLEADSFDDLDPDVLSQKAAEFIMDSHELGEADTGVPVRAHQAKHQGDSYTYWID